MSRTLTLLSVLLTLSGCAVGYNSTLFYTQSNIGLDAETKPPTAEISIARREGVIEPGFEGGQTPPVIAGFQSHTSPLSRFFFGVQSTFAGGDAAAALSQGPGGPNVSQASGLCLSTAPERRWWSFLSIPKKGEVMPFAFGTDTVFGLKVSWSGTAGPFPDRLRLGFNRKEPRMGTAFRNRRRKLHHSGYEDSGFLYYLDAIFSCYARCQRPDRTILPNRTIFPAAQTSPIPCDWVQYFATGTRLRLWPIGTTSAKSC